MNPWLLIDKWVGETKRTSLRRNAREREIVMVVVEGEDETVEMDFSSLRGAWLVNGGFQ